MGNAFELKTDGSLLEALKAAATKKAKPSELHEQRVSFVYGSLDSKSNVTREHIRQVIDEREELAA